MIVALEAKRQDWQARYARMMNDALNVDLVTGKQAQGLHGPRQTKVQERFDAELMRLSTLIAALEWTQGKRELRF